MHKIDRLLLKGKIIHLVLQSIRVETDNAISRTSLLHEGRGNKMENNSVTRGSTNTFTSPTMMDTPSKAQEGRVVVTAFMFESAIIVMRNMLVIILFAREKKLRKKSLFLVMNMAVADTVLGAVALPLHVYLTVGPEHEFIFHFLDTTFSQSSLISAGFISCERFYAVFWPLKHKTLSMRTYGIVIFTVWSLAILVSIIAVLFYEYNSFKVATLSWMSFPLSFLFIVCACNISI